MIYFAGYFPSYFGHGLGAPPHLDPSGLNPWASNPHFAAAAMAAAAAEHLRSNPAAAAAAAHGFHHPFYPGGQRLPMPQMHHGQDKSEVEKRSKPPIVHQSDQILNQNTTSK